MDVASVKEAANDRRVGLGRGSSPAAPILLGTLKDEILRTYPATVVEPEDHPRRGRYIAEDGDTVRIGALAKLSRRGGKRRWCKQKFALPGRGRARRPRRPPSDPWGTIGGNIVPACIAAGTSAAPDDRFHCIRKGGSYCPAHGGGQPLPFHLRRPGRLLRRELAGARRRRSSRLGATVRHHHARHPRRRVLQGERPALQRASGRRRS